MDKLFYAGTTEILVKSKVYQKDKRKRVKLVTIIDRKGIQWWYLFIGTKLIMRDRNRGNIEAFYSSY